MSTGRPGHVTAHDRFQVEVRMATGGRARLLVEDVQFQLTPHEQLHKLLRSRNPVVRHFVALQDGGPVDITYNPGLASNARHAAEEVALSLFHGIALAEMLKKTGRKHRDSRTEIASGRTGGYAPGYSYHTPAKVMDGVGIVYGVERTGRHAAGGFKNAQAVLDDLVKWAMRLPSQGYYVVVDGKPQALPVIEHEIRFQDLVPVDGRR
ncbi:hypothetical protein ACIHCM_35610 [Streptomyces sp. NPDC052023]|uniref:hypothetical protein n=1 Tax=Streptomyces sp. NPDC052023 TaxID=3365681 RepID=UPI0037D4874F